MCTNRPASKKHSLQMHLLPACCIDCSLCIPEEAVWTVLPSTQWARLCAGLQQSWKSDALQEELQTHRSGLTCHLRRIALEFTPYKQVCRHVLMVATGCRHSFEGSSMRSPTSGPAPCGASPRSEHPAPHQSAPLGPGSPSAAAHPLHDRSSSVTSSSSQRRRAWRQPKRFQHQQRPMSCVAQCNAAHPSQHHAILVATDCCNCYQQLPTDEGLISTCHRVCCSCPRPAHLCTTPC